MQLKSPKHQFLSLCSKIDLKYGQARSMASDISPFVARQLIEEGAGIQAVISGQKYIFQRNPGLNYFSYRKWRVTEDYAKSSEGRDKIYCIFGPNQQGPTVYTGQQFTTLISSAESVSAIPPNGSRYKPQQLKSIKQDINRLASILRKFESPTQHNFDLNSKNISV